MLKKFKAVVLTNFALLLTLVASSGVSSKSIFVMYEPDIPECLKR